jgi:TonB-linked SusC/RagA family outer membrane protein
MKRKTYACNRLFLTVAIFCLPLILLAQQSVPITGTVLDEAGKPVVSASVKLKAGNVTVVTDENGIFKINAPLNSALVISNVGFETKEVVVSDKAPTIILKTMISEMDQVVVVGYGTQKKSDVTGAVASVSAEALTNRPVNNAIEALQGKAAGVDIKSSERPGTIGSVRIRGNRSLSASNSPLYVVDGVPLMSASAIETLNPRDIESIDILKDASATAVYGSRGANGVIIVTTKQGKSGRFSLNYDGTVTTSKIVDRSPSMSAADFIEFRRWAAYNLKPDEYANPSAPTEANDRVLFASPLDGQTSRDNMLQGWAGGTWDPSKVTNTDWTEFVTQTGITSEHVLSASGGSDKMNAYGSFGYLNNKGTQKGQSYERYTSKLSINITPVSWFKMAGSLNISWSEQDYGMSTLGATSSSVPNAIYGAAKSIYNMAVPYDKDGNIVINPGGENGIYSVMDEWEKSTQLSQTLRALGNFSATIEAGKIWEPLKGLSYKLNFGPDFRHWREGVYIDGTSVRKMQAGNIPGSNYARLQNRRDFSWTLDNMITYDRTFASKHKVGATLLQTASSWNIESSSMTASNIPKPSFLWNAMGSVDITNTANKAGMSSDINRRQLSSYMVRLNYGFDSRYLLTVSGRWDGASQLGEGTSKTDFFPSAALAWRMDNEEFIKNTSWIDNLKLRLGVGTTGNAAVDPYATKGAISSIYLPFNGMSNQIGFTTNEPYYTGSQLALANSLLGWEKTTQYNLGLDFNFLKGRVSGSIDAYKSNTRDLLMLVKIPTLTGFPNTYGNIGKTKNHGIEVTLNFIPVETKSGFTWESNLNGAWQQDEIVELAYGKNDMVDNTWFIGRSINVLYGYDNLGLWQDTPEDQAEMALWKTNGYNFTPGNVRPKDQNGDHKMTIDDRVVLGNSNPKWTIGWNNIFSFKNIELSMSLYGRMGYTASLGGEALTAHSNQRQIDYWTPDNPNAEFQKPILGQATSGSQDQFSGLLGFKKASFVKIRNISLGYNVPKTVCAKIGISNLKLYGQALNPGNVYQSLSWYDFDTDATYFNRGFVAGLSVGF